MEATCSRLLSLLLLLLSPRAFAAGVADTLSKGSNITGNETLVSANGTFTMGFFSLGASTNQRYYLGIWFSVSRDAVCWVANSERPLSDKTGALVLSDTGNLLLRDGSGQIVWSSNSTIASSSSVEVQLLETGNLVLRDQGSSYILWQSFDHPSNTLLSGMKVGKDLWNGAEWHLTSWSSSDDPSPGLYRRVLDTSGLPDFVLLQGNVTIYRTGPWNGRSFSGATEVLGYTDLVTLGVTISPEEISYGYTSKPGAALTRLVVTADTRMVKRFVWDNSSREWNPIFQGPRDLCDDYGKCGGFGLCDVDSVLSFCSCLRGFSPASPSAWTWDAASGCRRNVELRCSNGSTTDGFVLVKGVKLPDTHNASVFMGITLKECRKRCRANCSCLAYAAADIRGGGVPSGCVMWTDNIVDLRYVDRGQDMYLRLAKSELDKDFTLVAVVAPVASTVAALALFLLIWWRRTKTKRTASDPAWSPTMGDRSIDLPAVKMSTGDFSQSHMIGEGGFAVVYKGELPDGRTVAVKRLKQSALTDKGQRDFAREVDVMANVRHGNVLRLLAYCNDGGERILIYAFMPNKSLDLYIFGNPSDRARLNWRQRLDIIHGVAHGVAYLHQGSEESVVHRDLKPSNVLLDDNWKPKIADFNTAKLFIKDQPDQSDLTIVVSPFGVVLLETLSGRRNGPTKGVISNARRFCQQDRAMALLDSTVPLPVSPPDSEISSELERYIKIGLLCVQEAPENRPDMSAVVAMLTTRNSDISLLARAAQQSHAED
ncbi:Receptor-like serine/threonine-protein kinase SD1-8 [Dichanthelium oligosanthes]|uniref:Receptor-like serine/threonine-protein kinase n=1 Tax=Dichanthelium oligosanthes TaxID=888268 RepID=A0A1E5VK85_9POAL|nr:Receptor-like serine/threonine-protein kinase SD1-8 [Dichanthelium oligosanthes]